MDPASAMVAIDIPPLNSANVRSAAGAEFGIDRVLTLFLVEARSRIARSPGEPRKDPKRGNAAGVRLNKKALGIRGLPRADLESFSLTRFDVSN
jgi:hypothetical protein